MNGYPINDFCHVIDHDDHYNHDNDSLNENSHECGREQFGVSLYESCHDTHGNLNDNLTHISNDDDLYSAAYNDVVHSKKRNVLKRNLHDAPRRNKKNLNIDNRYNHNDLPHDVNHSISSQIHVGQLEQQSEMPSSWLLV